MSFIHFPEFKSYIYNMSKCPSLSENLLLIRMCCLHGVEHPEFKEC